VTGVQTCALPICLADLSAITAPLLTDGDYYQFNYRQHARADALFAQMTWKLTTKIALVPGVRLGIEEKKVDVIGHGYCNSKDATGAILDPLGVSQPCIVQTLLNAEDYEALGKTRKEYDFSPKLAAQYFADHGVNYYASYARAVKSGGFNALALNDQNLQFQGEKAATYEIGAKGRFFDRTLNLNLGLYHTDFQNLQVLAYNGVAFDVGNAQAISRGIEGDFQWATPYRPLKLLGSFGLLDAHYTSYLAGPAPVSQGIGARQDLSGKRVAFAPRATGTFTPVLRYTLFDDLSLTLSGDVVYQGNQYTDTDLDPNTYTPAYYKYNARMILAGRNDRWSIAAGGNNLSDTRVRNQVIDTVFFPGTYQVQQASGRQVFVQISVKM
jgi:outer membrane receptor protein involved in Fe transport